MKRVLLTGMSGAGKTTVIRRLAELGYKAIDTDDGLSEWVAVPGDAPVRYSNAEVEWLWREDDVQRLLSLEDADVLFISGCVRNQVKLYPQFDHVVLLSAPADLLVERLATRTSNSYGKSADELAQVLQLLHAVEPALRKAASLEVDTSAPITDVVNTILEVVLHGPSRPSNARYRRVDRAP